jgi:hypothetical protein
MAKTNRTSLKDISYSSGSPRDNVTSRGYAREYSFFTIIGDFGLDLRGLQVMPTIRVSKSYLYYNRISYTEGSGDLRA